MSPAIDMADLKRKSVRGGMVTFGAQGISIAIQLASTVTLARLLSPDDYGVMAMVIAVTSFAGLFRDLGLSAAAIQKGTLTHAQMSNLFWLNVGMGILLTSALAASSPLVAWFYGKPELIPLTLLLSTTFLIGSLGTQHGALMQRELQFGRRAVTGIAGALAGLGVSIILALHGQGYWALAWGSITGGIVTTLLLFALSPFRPGLWTRGVGIRSMLKFGANITAFDFVNYFHRNLDNILIGKFWGADALGLYSRAYSLLMLPINTLRGPINAVGFPAMSRLQNQSDAFRDYYRKVTTFLALVSMPFSAFLFVASKPVIVLALGVQWIGIVPIFAILATVGFVQPVITLWGMVVLSRGMGKRYLQLGFFNAVCSIIGFSIGLHWGAIGVAAGYAVVTYITAYPILAWTFRGTPLCLKDFSTCIFRPFIASVIAVAGCRVWQPVWGELMPVQGLAVSAILFMTVYILAIWVLPGSKLDFELLKKITRQVTSIRGIKSCAGIRT
ncbi:hypothetical protein AW736_20195 [Termitidicoccus mucosus]|uniref:Polysaccharide biosynthesis protein C-terminal domain-containing protein n=2 Tax=Termitidicoccus mucosus TaxID=1184151 RepID=A0A178ID01_9BACT|nr:hypothetical protein AW736_20195 [Opitutaceae bacterium TSB47]